MKNTISRLLLPIQFIFLGMYFGSLAETAPHVSDRAVMWIGINLICWFLRTIITKGSNEIYTADEYESKYKAK